MNSIDLFFDSESDSDERGEILTLKRKRKHLRDSSNPLEMDSISFKRFFRLSKEAFIYLLKYLEPKMKQQKRLSAVPNIIKLAAVLRFFAEGGYQRGTASDFNLGLAQPTFSLLFKEMSEIMETFLCPKWISSQYTAEEKSSAKLFFFEKCRIPGVIGCIDGTHVKIIKPSEDVQHLYYNRKGFHSINVMIACDHRMKIRYINAKYPGASHDSMIWNSSELKENMKCKYNNGERNSWLLGILQKQIVFLIKFIYSLIGDSGYPLEPYLMTPFRAPDEGSSQSRFNSLHSKGRNIIERTIGVLKNRFRCLLGARQLHYPPEKATQIANICAALHNLCVHYNVPLTDELEIELTETNDFQEENRTDVDCNREALAVRDRIANGM